MLEPRQMNEDGLDVREANHRMMNMLAILLALFHRNFSKFSDQCVRGAVAKFENQILAASETTQAGAVAQTRSWKPTKPLSVERPRTARIASLSPRKPSCHSLNAMVA